LAAIDENHMGSPLVASERDDYTVDGMMLLLLNFLDHWDLLERAILVPRPECSSTIKKNEYFL
jgi:hypothetical protein